ncbi:ICOS ligand isoform X1 [Elgaria multicarinata webbii]|uniref:ICOS ligand isoform X1 n=1 Tax=Elgaria multicarinata webbii TaxID=159646 RepID=UPI002FCD0E31
MAPKSFGLMVLFLWIQRADNEPVVTGIIGSTVELRCHYTGEQPLIPNTFRIQWQKEGVTQCFVDAYFPNDSMEEYQCKEFKNRTQADKQPKDGHFSLKLWRISLNDEHTYECVIQESKNGLFRPIHHAKVTLKVAANYSKPVLTVLERSEEEMTFSCNSSHGYPQQKLYWINQTDNSLLNATETSIKEPDGTFSVYSVLTIKTASDIKLGCQIENERLQQNITTIFESSSSTSSPRTDAHQHKTTIVLSAVAPAVAIALILILYILCDKNKPSRQGTYTGVFENEEAAQHNAPV